MTNEDKTSAIPVETTAAPLGAPELPIYWRSEIERFNKELEDERAHYEYESHHIELKVQSDK